MYPKKSYIFLRPPFLNQDPNSSPRKGKYLYRLLDLGKRTAHASGTPQPGNWIDYSDKAYNGPDVYEDAVTGSPCSPGSKNCVANPQAGAVCEYSPLAKEETWPFTMAPRKKEL